MPTTRADHRASRLRENPQGVKFWLRGFQLPCFWRKLHSSCAENTFGCHETLEIVIALPLSPAKPENRPGNAVQGKGIVARRQKRPPRPQPRPLKPAPAALANRPAKYRPQWLGTHARDRTPWSTGESLSPCSRNHSRNPSTSVDSAWLPLDW